MRAWIGIDLGRQGGIAVVDQDGKLTAVYNMPLTKEKETDALALYVILKEQIAKYDGNCHVIFERVNSFFGIGQAQIVGVCRESGIVESATQIAGAPYSKITPRKWQNFMFANEKQIYKDVKGKAKLDTKKMSCNRFVKSFPDYKKFPIITKNTGNLRDGICDSGMLALYGKMNNF